MIRGIKTNFNHDLPRGYKEQRQEVLPVQSPKPIYSFSSRILEFFIKANDFLVSNYYPSAKMVSLKFTPFFFVNFNFFSQLRYDFSSKSL